MEIVFYVDYYRCLQIDIEEFGAFISKRKR